MADSEVDRLNNDDSMKAVWTKLQALRSYYLNDMIELYGLLTSSTCNPPRRFKMRTKDGRSFWCPILCGVASLSCLPGVGASSASAPGTSDHSTLDYAGKVATIIGPFIAAISLGVTIYNNRRSREEASVNLNYRCQFAGSVYQLPPA